MGDPRVYCRFCNEDTRGGPGSLVGDCRREHEARCRKNPINRANAKDAEIVRLTKEVERLTACVGDLQSGMYINCVYCGHHYGPVDKVAPAMADVLKQHIERCPKHPMSALKAEVERLKRIEIHYHEVLDRLGFPKANGPMSPEMQESFGDAWERWEQVLIDAPDKVERLTEQVAALKECRHGCCDGNCPHDRHYARVVDR